jgi:type I restriction enzyme S subunit
MVLGKTLIRMSMKNNVTQKNIPDGWQQVVLGNCLNRNPEYGINAAATKLSPNLPTYIRITDISEDGKLIPEGLTSVSHINSSNYFLDEGDLVFARTGASVGKTYLYNRIDGRLVYAGFLIKVTTNKKIITPHFLYYFTKTHQYWKWILITSSRSGQPGINSPEIKSLKLKIQ